MDKYSLIHIFIFILLHQYMVSSVPSTAHSTRLVFTIFWLFTVGPNSFTQKQNYM